MDDSTRLAARAKDAGVEVTLKIADDMIHVWHYFAPLIPEGEEAIAEAGEFSSRRTYSLRMPQVFVADSDCR